MAKTKKLLLVMLIFSSCSSYDHDAAKRATVENCMDACNNQVLEVSTYACKCKTREQR